jgi:protoheme IX farnesyltransferase
MKLRIVELLLVTTVPAMLLAHHGVPRPWLIAVVLVGGALAAGAANALNCFIDRDIDRLMRRTSRRALPSHAVAPRSAVVFGLCLAAISAALMAAFTNWLATGLTVAAIAYYDLVYTLWLKRTTPQNTLWGGVCGAMPVLIGWAAVTGSLAAPAWAMFALVFFWQPPHFYALAIRFKDDYARAGIPMLPVVATGRRVEHGYDPVYGARPLRRYLAREVETRIGRALLSGELGEQGEIRIDARDGTLNVELIGAREPAHAS